MSGIERLLKAEGASNVDDVVRIVTANSATERERALASAIKLFLTSNTGKKKKEYAEFEFNHDSDSLSEAIGVDVELLMKKFALARMTKEVELERDLKKSEVIELIVNFSDNPVHCAVVALFSIPS